MKDYNRIHQANALRYSRLIENAYQRVIGQFSTMAQDPTAKFSKSFAFANHKKLSTLANNYTKKFAEDVEKIIANGIEEEWALSNEKNNALVQEHMKGSRALKVNPNLAAGYSIKQLRAFANRQMEGIRLSSRVWDVAQGMKFEMETHLALGIANGESAQTISRRMRQYLNDPEKLFRRIRDDAGKLVPSKAMKEYRPGQGVYRSSYKNALRIARTETNIAYHSADHLRWSEMDFIVGIRISLSHAHPVYDICDILKGKYPKDFKFTGWHPQCLCNATPIMLDDDEYDKYEDALLEGEDYDPTTSKNFIGDVPRQFKGWVKDNKKQAQGWKSTPYFIRDNLDKNWKFKPTKVVVPGEDLVPKITKPVRVADAFSRVSTNIQTQFSHAMKMIGRVHDDGNLPRIPMISFGSRRMAGFYATRRTPQGSRVGSEIGISSSGSWKDLTIVHETGHFLDHHGIGAPDDFNTLSGGLLRGFKAAARDSNAVKELLAARQRGVLRKGGQDIPMRQSEYQRLDYLLMDQEIWARAYAQYIATKSGDPKLLRQLDRKKTASGLFQDQWDAEDFVPLQQEIDKVFKLLGWLKTE